MSVFSGEALEFREGHGVLVVRIDVQPFNASLSAFAEFLREPFGWGGRRILPRHVISVARIPQGARGGTSRNVPGRPPGRVWERSASRPSWGCREGLGAA
ncbi:MAG TPA: hypothetical protein VII22_26040 [Streptosporangiaceae bacterium]